MRNNERPPLDILVELAEYTEDKMVLPLAMQYVDLVWLQGMDKYLVLGKMIAHYTNQYKPTEQKLQEEKDKILWGYKDS